MKDLVIPFYLSEEQPLEWTVEQVEVDPMHSIHLDTGTMTAGPRHCEHSSTHWQVQFQLASKGARTPRRDGLVAARDRGESVRPGPARDDPDFSKLPLLASLGRWNLNARSGSIPVCTPGH